MFIHEDTVDDFWMCWSDQHQEDLSAPKITILTLSSCQTFPPLVTPMGQGTRDTIKTQVTSPWRNSSDISLEKHKWQLSASPWSVAKKVEGMLKEQESLKDGEV